MVAGLPGVGFVALGLSLGVDGPVPFAGFPVHELLVDEVKGLFKDGEVFCILGHSIHPQRANDGFGLNPPDLFAFVGRRVERSAVDREDRTLQTGPAPHQLTCSPAPILRVRCVAADPHDEDSTFEGNLRAMGHSKIEKTLQVPEVRELVECLSNCNGEGGIRTRGKDKPHTAFPRPLLKPLGHLSGACCVSISVKPRLCKAESGAAEQDGFFFRRKMNRAGPLKD